MCVCLRRTITKVYAVACRAAVAVVDEKTKEKLIEKRSGLYEAGGLRGSRGFGTPTSDYRAALSAI